MLCIFFEICAPLYALACARTLRCARGIFADVHAAGKYDLIFFRRSTAKPRGTFFETNKEAPSALPKELLGYYSESNWNL